MERLTGVCVDSDVLIDYLRGYNPAREFFVEISRTARLYVSSVSVAEIYSGQDAGNNTKQLSEFLDNFLLLPLTPEMAKLAGEIRRESKTPFADSLIAATTIIFNFPLVTRNKKHFTGIKNLKLLTPY